MQIEKIQGKNFLISYTIGMSGFYNTETALIRNRKYYILNGNHISAYSKLVKKGYKACKEYFDKKNKGKYINFWSNE